MTLLGVALSAAAEQGKPYTHRNYFDDPDEFRFAIIPDRFGADYRAKDYHTDFRLPFACRVVNLKSGCEERVADGRFALELTAGQSCRSTLTRRTATRACRRCSSFQTRSTGSE